MSEHGHQIGFWRHPGHVRKCDEARRFNFAKAVARGAEFYRRKQRREAFAAGVAVFAGVLAGAGLVAITVSLILGAFR